MMCSNKFSLLLRGSKYHGEYFLPPIKYKKSISELVVINLIIVNKNLKRSYS